MTLCVIINCRKTKYEVFVPFHLYILIFISIVYDSIIPHPALNIGLLISPNTEAQAFLMD
jgi:hypothetical protein